ncbi:hypothetical protein L1887_47900 [Cichorium endivia]|nr:hypothetical protein L1887_47900 [Cichorium endivia]
MHLSPRHLLSASLRVAAVFLSARLAVHSDLLASPFLFGSHLFFFIPCPSRAFRRSADVPSQLEHSSNSFVAHEIWLESATVPDLQRQDHVSHPRCCDNGLSIAVAAHETVSAVGVRRDEGTTISRLAAHVNMLSAHRRLGTPPAPHRTALFYGHCAANLHATCSLDAAPLFPSITPHGNGKAAVEERSIAGCNADVMGTLLGKVLSSALSHDWHTRVRCGVG